MKDLRIFISYSHEDSPIATALSNLLQQALGPSCETFLDRSAISFGSEIKSAIVESLDRADVLIAIMTGAQPTSTLSWPAWEISRFCAGWDPKFRDAELHGTKEANEVIGRVIVISNGKIHMGPEWGKRNVQLGISEQLLSDNKESSNDTQVIRKSVMPNSEVLDFMRKLEGLVSSEHDYEGFFRERNKTLVDLVTDFKLAAYHALKRRIRGISKPSRQLIVHYSPSESEHPDSLPDGAKVFSIGGASDIFGKLEDDTQLFTKTSDATPGGERYETNWRSFKDSVLGHKHGAYWCGVLEKASTYYWRNFESASDPLRTRVKDLVMELDYLKSEAVHANLEKPGAYEDLITGEELTQMMKIWKEVESGLRSACNLAIDGTSARQGEAELNKQIVTQLKRLFKEVKPFNSLLGAALARRLCEIFGRDNGNQEEP